MKNIFFVTILIITTSNVYSQDIYKVQNAFETSYTMEKKNNIGNAISALVNIYNKDSYEINLRLGWLYYTNGDFISSTKYYTIANKLLPYSEEAKLGLILPKSATANWNDVINIYKQILTISPNNTNANYKLGLIYYNQKKYGYAHVMFEKVVNLYPFDYDGLLMFGWSSLQIGKYKEARIIFNKVLMYSPKDSSAQEGLKLLNKK